RSLSERQVEGNPFIRHWRNDLCCGASPPLLAPDRHLPSIRAGPKSQPPGPTARAMQQPLPSLPLEIPVKPFSKVAWAALALLGAFCLGTVALRRGVAINALWIVVAAISIYIVAYRFYVLFICNRVLGLDPTRATPAVLRNDGL